MKSDRIKEVFSGFEAMGRMGNGHAPMGFKLMGRRGKNRCAVPDPVQRRIMGEIVRVRDKYGWTFDAIGDYIDQWLAETEGRKRTPRWEREWSSQRCRRAYNVEVALRKEATSQPPSAGL